MIALSCNQVVHHNQKSTELCVCLCAYVIVSMCIQRLIRYQHNQNIKTYTWREKVRKMHLTLQLQANKVSVAQVFQKDAVRRAGLEIERDVGGRLALERGKMQIGRRGGE